MGRIPDSFIDGLLARVDLVEVIGSRLPLQRKGREYSCCCPFHDERTASFYVSPTKQFYHCFGCGAHGTAIKFLMEYDRLDFVDAVEELAKRVGLEVPREAGREPARQGEALYAVLDAAQAWFRQQLGQSSAAHAYLEGRGLQAASIEHFGIGWAAEGWSGLIDALGRGEPRRIELLEQAGLLSKNEQGRIYDKFRGRIMFPIHDRRGRVIAFGGRILGKDEGPKYLNSPETPLFHKGRELYGLWQVRQAHRRIPRLIVVEGYMDVVSLWQHGIDTAVATLGTATTPEQAELLFRNASDVYFCFDGDEAGRKAAWKALEAVLPRMGDGRQAFFLFLPEGEDPDSLVRQQGAAAFEQALAGATPLSETLFRQLESGIDLRHADGKAKLAEQAKALIQRIPEGEFRDRMQALLVQRTTVGFHAAARLSGLSQELDRLGEQVQHDALSFARGQVPQGYLLPAPQRRSRPPVTAQPQRSIVRSAIALLMAEPTLAQRVGEMDWLERLDLPGLDLFIELIRHCQQRPPPNTGALLEAFAGHPQIGSLVRVAALALPGDEALRGEEFEGCLLQLRKRATAQRIDQLRALPVLDEAGKSELRRLLTQDPGRR